MKSEVVPKGALRVSVQMKGVVETKAADARREIVWGGKEVVARVKGVDSR